MAFDNIKLDKGLYSTTKGFTASLEEIDPSENYIGTELEGLDAYQRQLKRFDIKVSGRDSDCVSKFFSSTDSAALFPEYISRAVAQGMEENDVLSRWLPPQRLSIRSITAPCSLQRIRRIKNLPQWVRAL